MFNTLYLLNYNNYYNRLIKKENTLEDYMDYVVATLTATNFNPGDHVSAEHIVNIDDSLAPDYAIVIDSNGNIVSRWFIIESSRVRGNQYNLTLYRDTIVDYYNIVTQAATFIEKATLPMENPLIFNDEDMGFNQIKSKEYLLKDESGCPWLVGYYSKKWIDTNDELTDYSFSGTVLPNNMNNLGVISLGVNTIDQWEFYPYTQQGMLGPIQSGYYSLKAAIGPPLGPEYAQFNINDKSGATERTTLKNKAGVMQINNVNESQIQKEFLAFGMNKLNPVPYIGSVTKETVDEVLKFQGKLVATLEGKFYKIHIGSYAVTPQTVNITSGALYNNLKTIASDIGFYTKPNEFTFSYTYLATQYVVTLTPREDLEISYNIPETGKLVTSDAPWNIFAIPYGEVTIKGIEGGDIVTSKELGLALAAGIQLQHQQNIFDIQLLPYCPIQGLITDDRTLTVSNSYQYSIVKGPNDTNVGVIFNVDKSEFTFDITSVTIPVATSATEKKVNSQCDKWRLASPNYSNYFDFNVEKNGGIQLFNVDCNYKPYNPYIHINPNFGGLYGNDFNDPRGLVLGGDFSISQVGDAWRQYEIQNKNYQASFDRQIQNMELNNSIQRKQQRWEIAAGAVSTGASGLVAGALLGGGGGAAIGGVLGAGASLAAGIADYKLSEQLRNEAIDYTKDQFGYQLGNIQALPHTISKVSALNANNKLFPVLEYYTCTEVEKEALRNKIKYNGMTVMTIGTINDYIQSEPTYIKGQIIRFNNLDGEFHIAKTIAKEINQGIYI